MVADEKFGLPYGQDRLVPIWIASLAIRQRSRTISFSFGAEILHLFGLQQEEHCRPVSVTHARMHPPSKQLISAQFGSFWRVAADFTDREKYVAVVKGDDEAALFTSWRSPFTPSVAIFPANP
jgi:hypothetical protein